MELAYKGKGLTNISVSSKLDVVKTVLIARWKIIMRYKGALVMEVFIPIVFAALPIFLGVAIAGGPGPASQNFAANTGTEDYKLYMLIGANTFTVVMLMMWLVGFWIRREQESGTLESLYLTPSKRVHIVSGVTLYALLRSMITFTLAMILGSILFGINPLQGNVLLATAFLLIGLIPMWGISFAFGALILKIKEAHPLINLMTWVVAFFMGVYFPITIFPPLLRYVAMAFPPTWMTHGVRASLLDLSYFFGGWYFDIAMIFVFAAIAPLIGYSIFLGTEKRIKRKEGVGLY